MCVIVVCFFFQAEDGIRDLVRSRGLGDVYKRQASAPVILGSLGIHRNLDLATFDCERQSLLLSYLQAKLHCLTAVSYTHLTLPTSDLV